MSSLGFPSTGVALKLISMGQPQAFLSVQPCMGESQVFNHPSPPATLQGLSARNKPLGRPILKLSLPRRPLRQNQTSQGVFASPLIRRDPELAQEMLFCTKQQSSYIALLHCLTEGIACPSQEAGSLSMYWSPSSVW